MGAPFREILCSLALLGATRYIVGLFARGSPKTKKGGLGQGWGLAAPKTMGEGVVNDVF
jgi:hypothetical protein